MLSTALHRLRISLLLLCLVPLGLCALKGDSRYNVKLASSAPGRKGYNIFSPGYEDGRGFVNWIVLKPPLKEMIILAAKNGEDRPKGKPALHLNDVLEAMWVEHSGLHDIKTLQTLNFVQVYEERTVKAITQTRKLLQVKQEKGFVLDSTKITAQPESAAEKQKQAWNLFMSSPFVKAAQRMGPAGQAMRVVVIEVVKGEYHGMDDIILHIR